jgi:PleD family two-component response regulator
MFLHGRPSGTSVAVPQQQVRLGTTERHIIKEGIMEDFKSGFFMSETTCNGRVLIVDDEPDIRKVVRMTLQKAGL